MESKEDSMSLSEQRQPENYFGMDPNHRKSVKFNFGQSAQSVNESFSINDLHQELIFVDKSWKSTLKSELKKRFRR